MGMSLSGWRLAASILEDPEYYVVAHAAFSDPRYQIWHWPDPDQLPTFFFQALKVPFGIHFPYDWEVEPD